MTKEAIKSDKLSIKKIIIMGALVEALLIISFLIYRFIQVQWHSFKIKHKMSK